MRRWPQGSPSPRPARKRREYPVSLSLDHHRPFHEGMGSAVIGVGARALEQMPPAAASIDQSGIKAAVISGDAVLELISVLPFDRRPRLDDQVRDLVGQVEHP